MVNFTFYHPSSSFFFSYSFITYLFWFF
jgi:hypothetical protein